MSRSTSSFMKTTRSLLNTKLTFQRIFRITFKTKRSMLKKKGMSEMRSKMLLKLTQRPFEMKHMSQRTTIILLKRTGTLLKLQRMWQMKQIRRRIMKMKRRSNPHPRRQSGSETHLQYVLYMPFRALRKRLQRQLTNVPV